MSEGHSDEHPEDGGAVRVEPDAAAAADRRILLENLVADLAPPRWALAALLILIVAGSFSPRFGLPPWRRSSLGVRDPAPRGRIRRARRAGVGGRETSRPRRGSISLRSNRRMGRWAPLDELEAAGKAPDRPRSRAADRRTAAVAATARQRSKRNPFPGGERNRRAQKFSRSFRASAAPSPICRGGSRPSNAGCNPRATPSGTMRCLHCCCCRSARRSSRRGRFRPSTTRSRRSAHDPDLAAAAEPLAEAARNGVASRAVLSKRLAELAGQIAPPTEPPADVRLGSAGARPASRPGDDPPDRRRIANRAGSGGRRRPSRARSRRSGRRRRRARAAHRSERRGGAPWLHMARERLAVETALDHLQQLLTARLGSEPSGSGRGPGPPAEKARSPSDPRRSSVFRLRGLIAAAVFLPITPGRSRSSGRAGKWRPRSACWSAAAVLAGSVVALLVLARLADRRQPARISAPSARAPAARRIPGAHSGHGRGCRG